MVIVLNTIIHVIGFKNSKENGLIQSPYLFPLLPLNSNSSRQAISQTLSFYYI